MGKKVDVDDLVSAPEIATRLRLYDRTLPHTWLRSQPSFPQPVAKLAIGHVWQWSAVERWAAQTGRGRWQVLPEGLEPDLLVPLRAWAAEHEVHASDHRARRRGAAPPRQAGRPVLPRPHDGRSRLDRARRPDAGEAPRNPSISTPEPLTVLESRPGVPRSERRGPCHPPAHPAPCPPRCYQHPPTRGRTPGERRHQPEADDCVPPVHAHR